MRKEIFERLKKELVYLTWILVLVLVIFKAVFYKEDFAVIIRFALSSYFVFVLPGFSLLLYWAEKLGFFERFVVSIPCSAALIGILSYYIGIAGLHIKYLSFILPLFLILLGLGICFFSSSNAEENAGSKQ